MDSVCLQRIKNWARDDLDMKITNSELEKICNHFGGARKLFEKLQQFGIQTLTYLPILLNNYQECPLTFPNKRTPEGADSLLFSLKDNVTENPVFKNDISFTKMFNEAIADNFGHFSKPDDSTLALAAHFLKSNILVFDGDRNKVDFYDGNLLEQDNVVNTFPFLLGHSRKQYQALIPDNIGDPEAYQKIRKYAVDIILKHQIREAVKRSMETISSKYLYFRLIKTLSV